MFLDNVLINENCEGGVAVVWVFFKKSDFRIQLLSVDKTAHRKLLF